MSKQVQKTAVVKSAKTKKPYKATALSVLAIISLIFAIALLIAGIVLLATGERTYPIVIEGTKVTVDLLPVYIAMVIDGVFAIVCAILSLIAKTKCKSFGLMLALGICNIVFCGTLVQIALGVVGITHANKIKKGLWPK